VKALGVDPGTAVTGYGVVEPVSAGGESNGAAGHLVECGVLRTDASQPLERRLADLYRGIRDLIARHAPDAVAVEGVFYHKNVRTTVVLGHARGVVLLAAAEAGVQVFEYPPATVKRVVTGGGAARKQTVAYMVQKLLSLSAPPRPDDAADGVAVALTHLLRNGR
jgi:crossover junction endodeoxyribonuclease RuvC